MSGVWAEWAVDREAGELVGPCGCRVPHDLQGVVVMTTSTFVADWTNRAGVPVGRAEFDTEAAAEHEAAWRRRDGGRAVVWCRGGVEA